MLQVSLAEKLEILKKTMFSSSISIIALAIILFIGFLFATTNKHNSKESKKIYILLYITCGFALLIKYAKSLMDLVDYFMNHVFILVYFPNLAIYFLAIIISNIMMWKSMFKNENKSLKIVNTIFFCGIHYLFVLLLGTISKNNLNIFELTSVYSDKTALSLIELTSFLFIIWIILTGIYSIVRRIIGPNEELVLDEIPEDSKYKIKIEKPYRIVESPKEAFETKERKQAVPQMTSEKQAQVQAIYDSMLTVEDYKILLELLKEYRYKEKIEASELQENNYRVNDLQSLYGKAK